MQRVLAATCAAALALPALTTAAAAETAVHNPMVAAVAPDICAQTSAPAAFDDGGAFGPYAECLAAHGIAHGVSARRFGHAGEVNRGQMAKFLTGLIETATGEQLPTGAARFSDVAGTAFDVEIRKIAAAGIADGRGDGRYGPGAAVSRGQMAKMLAATVETLAGAPLPAGSDAFSDDDGSAFEQFIDQLAAAGMASGYDDATFRPGRAVTRGQMAKFLVDCANKLAELGAWQSEGPAIPTGLFALPADGAAQIGWRDVGSADSYEVYQASSVHGPWSRVATGIRENTHVVRGLANGVDYALAVVAVDAGQRSRRSAPVLVAPAPVPDEQPALAATTSVVDAPEVLQAWTFRALSQQKSQAAQVLVTTFFRGVLGCPAELASRLGCYRRSHIVTFRVTDWVVDGGRVSGVGGADTRAGRSASERAGGGVRGDGGGVVPAAAVASAR